MQKLKKELLGIQRFTPKILQAIEEEKLWNIWVPKKFGGLEKSFSEGISILKQLAKIDGSLGWTVTLCSGANYFIGNLQPETAAKIFKSDKSICFGGSGAIGGIAKKEGTNYRISGKWRYATGSLYLTHFTLNAKIVENGHILKNPDGSEVIRSFVIPKDQVKIIRDWNTIGLKATVTNSFEIKDALVPNENKFIYNKFYQSQSIFKIPFALFADLTLWINYIGMAAHFIEECERIGKIEVIQKLQKVINDQENCILNISLDIEKKTENSLEIDEEQIGEIHHTAAKSVSQISNELIAVYPKLGIKACTIGAELNQIFLDYFTATQHHIFANK